MHSPLVLFTTFLLPAFVDVSRCHDRTIPASVKSKGPRSRGLISRGPRSRGPRSRGPRPRGPSPRLEGPPGDLECFPVSSTEEGTPVFPGVGMVSVAHGAQNTATPVGGGVPRWNRWSWSIAALQPSQRYSALLQTATSAKCLQGTLSVLSNLTCPIDAGKRTGLVRTKSTAGNKTTGNGHKWGKKTKWKHLFANGICTIIPLNYCVYPRNPVQ